MKTYDHGGGVGVTGLGLLVGLRGQDGVDVVGFDLKPATMAVPDC